MFKKLLASVGIGSAKVDTIILSNELTPGGILPVEIQIKGGDVEQQINGLVLRLMTIVEVEGEDSESLQHFELHRWNIDDAFKVEAEESISAQFELELPAETPISTLHCRSNGVRVWLATGLDIAQGIDSSDKDMLSIYPTPIMASVLQAVEQCGFTLYSTDVEKGYLRGPNFSSHSGCYQEIEYRPSGFGMARFKEVEVSFVPEAEQLHVMLEVDRRFGGDSLRSLTLHQNDAQEYVAMKISQLLR